MRLAWQRGVAEKGATDSPQRHNCCEKVRSGIRGYTHYFPTARAAFMRSSLVVGLAGLLLGGLGLTRTAISGAATLRGGRRILRRRQPILYWSNVGALCILVLLSVGLIFLGSTTAGR